MKTNKINDTHVFNVVLQYAERAQKGFEKYGTTTERTDIDLKGWLQHLQEELMDATIYIERIKYELNTKSNNGIRMQEKPQQVQQSANNNMQLSEYLNLTHQTAIYPEAGTGSNLELYYLSLGLVSEAGEVAGKVKKLIRDGKLDVGNLAYELGDCFWYLVRLCDAIGYSPEDVTTININKLLKRKENGTIQGSGDHR
jgi:NTP pyrophosphatase (non-canonical NTP hydrolase)